MNLSVTPAGTSFNMFLNFVLRCLVASSCIIAQENQILFVKNVQESKQ